MKKLGLLKKVVTAVLAGAMMCSVLTACGGAIKMDDIKGEWTVDTYNGQSVADYAAANGLSEGQCVMNWNIKEDDTVEVEGVTGTATYDIERKSNGFEVYEKGAEKKKENIQFSVTYDKDKATLSYTVDVAGNKTDFVLKKGKGTVEALAPADDSSEGGEDAAPADDGSEGGEDAAPADDGSEGGEDAAPVDDGSEGGEEGEEAE